MLSFPDTRKNTERGSFVNFGKLYLPCGVNPKTNNPSEFPLLHLAKILYSVFVFVLGDFV